MWNKPLNTQEQLKLLHRAEVLIDSSQVYCETASFFNLLESASFRGWLVAQCWRPCPPSLPTGPHLPARGNPEVMLAEPACNFFCAGLCCLPCYRTWTITRDRTVLGCLFPRGFINVHNVFHVILRLKEKRSCSYMWGERISTKHLGRLVACLRFAFSFFVTNFVELYT